MLTDPAPNPAAEVYAAFFFGALLAGATTTTPRVRMVGARSARLTAPDRPFAPELRPLARTMVAASLVAGYAPLRGR